MVQAQEWLDENYPLELRSETVELDIRNRNLQGSLKLKEFANLKKLNCANNQLTELDLSDCPNLEKLECCDNQLIDLEFLNNLNQKKMINLEISNNNFSNNCDLNLLSSFVNLKELGLGNKNDSYERIRQGVYNRFIGSLEPLKNMNKLEKLDISNTDINSGLEYLPDKLEIFYCLTSERPEAKVKAIYNLFANEKGIVEEEELIGSIKDFPQKLQKYKTSLQIPQIKAEIDKILATNNFNSEQLVQQLISDNHANSFEHTWQDYLSFAKTLKELETRKNKILATIENLKKVQNLEKQKQEELRQAEIRRILTTLISVERLYTIRRVMDRFLERWKNGLPNLQWVEEFKYGISTIQWANRGVLIASGVQLIRGESAMSDWTTLISPFIEVFISNLVERHESNKLKQSLFAEDAEDIWDNYNDLKAMLDPIEISILDEGEVKKTLKELSDKIHSFWKEYDTNKDGEIDDEEWKKARESFSQNLRDNWPARKAELMIIKEIAENLRKEISNYRKTEAKRLGSEQNEVIKNQHTTINLDNYFEQQEQTPASSRTNLLSKIQQEEIELQKVEQKALQIQPAYGTPGSSKK